jgi:hypothetical protein
MTEGMTTAIYYDTGGARFIAGDSELVTIDGVHLGPAPTGPVNTP